MTAELERRLIDLKQGDHVCLIYENTTEQLAAVVPFVKEGLARNERCVVVADEATAAEALQALGTAGIDVAEVRQRGALQVLNARDVYRSPAEFDLQAMADFVRQADQEALAAGFAGLRLSGDTSWVLGPEDDCDRLAKYEALLNRLFQNSHTVILCHYHRGNFDGPCIHDVLRNHPLAVIGDQVCTNPHYQPPGLEVEGRPRERFASLRTRVEWWIAHVRRAQTAGRESAELIKLLQTLSARLLEVQEAELQQRKSEEHYRETADRLRDANTDLESFAFTLAHDLRAPVRSIQGLTQALLEDCGNRLEARALDYVRRIDRSGEELDRLIQDLLDYGRLSRADLVTERVNLQAVVEKALAQLESDIRQSQACVTVDGPLPHVVGHRTTLVQVVTNLLSNAIKFVARGVEPRVRVWAEGRTDTIRLWVEDNGIGIAPEDHQRVFQAFERLHAGEVYPGSGIGLATVLKGMERLGGRSGVESALGSGSRFWIELPRFKEAPD